MSHSSSDLTFITNEVGNTVRDRLAVLLTQTKQFDVLVGYFFISGFHRIYRDLHPAEKVRILVGLKTDRPTFRALEEAKQRELALMSHAETRDAVPDVILAGAAKPAEVPRPGMILDELERSEDPPRRMVTARS